MTPVLDKVRKPYINFCFMYVPNVKFVFYLFSVLKCSFTEPNTLSLLTIRLSVFLNFFHFLTRCV